MDLKVNEYLRSLPSDTHSIYLSNKKLNSLPDLSRFYNLQILFCDHNQLTTLPEFPPQLIELYCDHNQLTSLPPFSENLQIIYCDHNQLTSLPPFNLVLEIINCQNNQLTSLPRFGPCLTLVYCQHNELTHLHTFNESLGIFHCYDNMLTNLPPFPPNLRELYCYDNPMDDIVDSLNNSIDEVNYKLLQLYNFKKFWFQLKLKKKFRDWLWIRIREPRIREKYSTANLLNLLNNAKDDDELDNLLKAW